MFVMKVALCALFCILIFIALAAAFNDASVDGPSPVVQTQTSAAKSGWVSMKEIEQQRAARDVVAAQNGLAISRDQFTAHVVQDERMGRIKRSIVVDLSRPISKDMLEDIGHQLRGQAWGFERTFIAYFLPGMVDGCGAWATTHFNPKLEVRVVGFTLENQRAMGCFDE